MKYTQKKNNILRSGLKKVPFYLSFFAILAVLYEFGFNHQPIELEFLQHVYVAAVSAAILSVMLRYFFTKSRPGLKVLPFDILLLLYLLVLVLSKLDMIQSQHSLFLILKHRGWLHLAILLIFIRESSTLQINYKRLTVNPAQLFIISFLLLILIGGALLKLPNATSTHISLMDAMFTATSAVCVTGLTVVDTGGDFTVFGQLIILTLIQLGGLGIMTFASYFGYFFKGNTTYGNQLLLSEISNSDRIGEVFNTLKKVLWVTFFIEGAGAVLIFYSIDSNVISAISDRVYFSVFHSISGFCNAGFSTMPNGLFEDTFQFNYPLHLIIATLIIFGGLGFPIVFNLLKLLRNRLKNMYLVLFKKRRAMHLPWIININSRIVLLTSLILIVLGSGLIFTFEYNNTLAGHTFSGKIVTAFFSAVTPRTAGFNTVDTSALTLPTVFIVLFLMWVGASPGSTGGGIKTSTLAIAILNIIRLAKGKSRIEIFRREIAQISVDRAFSIIFLSLIVIGLAIFCIALTDIEKGLFNISFECVSAYSTVGLSRGITAQLSNPGKMILILTMFIGRVNMLNILIAISKKQSAEKYRYPAERILIN